MGNSSAFRRRKARPPAPPGFTVAAQKAGLIRGTRPSELITSPSLPGSACDDPARPGRGRPAVAGPGPRLRRPAERGSARGARGTDSRPTLARPRGSSPGFSIACPGCAAQKAGAEVRCSPARPPPCQRPPRKPSKAPPAPESRSGVPWGFGRRVPACARRGVRLRSVIRLKTAPGLLIDFHVKRIQSSR